MNVSDTLLVKMIEQDMKCKGISEKDYHIAEDKAVESPNKIELQSNEMLYVYCFLMQDDIDFLVQLISATDFVNYNNQNSKLNDVGHYENSVISRHWSTVSIKNNNDSNFIIRYVKVVFTSNKQSNP